MMVLTTPLATSFRKMFYVYRHAVKHHHTNIIVSLLSIPFVLKLCHKKFENWFINKIFVSKTKF